MLETGIFSLDDAESDCGGALPFRLLVLAQFSQDINYAEFYKSEPIDISLRNFRRVLSQQNLRLVLMPDNNTFSDKLLSATQAKDYQVNIRQINDFSPESIARQERSIRVAVRLLEKLIACQEAGGVTDRLQVSDVENQLLDNVPPRDVGELMFAIAELRDNINHLVNDLLHQEELQIVEAAWRSLHWLVKIAGDHSLCEVSFLPVNKAILKEDLSSAVSFEETHLYELVYSREYGQFGGRPYGALISDLDFGKKGDDLELLSSLGRLSAKSHAPFIAAVAPDFFGVDSYSELANMLSVEELLQSVRYHHWQKFQETPESIYVMLTLPRVLLRGPYSYENHTLSSGLFEEDISGADSDCLWGSAAFAFGVNCIESFKKHQLCTELLGDNGKVIGLNRSASINMVEESAPVEVLLSENREAELVRQGFTPLSVNKKSRELIFFSANSVHWGHCSRQYKAKAVDDMDQLLASQFSYLFIILRVVHYLKILSRSYIGGNESVPVFEASLNRWLRNYVSDVENPSVDVRASRPLRSVSLKISDVLDDPGWYQAKLSLIPHQLYLGKHFEMSLPFSVSSPVVAEK